MKKLVPYTDAKGRRHWVEVESDLARALDTFDRNLRRRESLYKRHHVHETDLEAWRASPKVAERRGEGLIGFLCVELEPAYQRVYGKEEGSPWKGPVAQAGARGDADGPAVALCRPLPAWPASGRAPGLLKLQFSIPAYVKNS